MTCPPAVGRGLLRLGLGVAVLATSIAVGGALLARQQLGRASNDTRLLVEADVQARVATLGRVLDTAVLEAGQDGQAVERAAGGAAEPVRLLFDRISVAGTHAGRDLVALTIYGPDAVPVAWEGRPATLPPTRLAAGAASFVVPTALGHRLARVQPIHLPNGGRRVGTVVAEATLSESGADLGSTQAPIQIRSRLAPVVLRPGNTDIADVSSFAVTATDGSVLGRAQVTDEDLDATRRRWWRGVVALEWMLIAIGLLLMAGPLADWRAVVRMRGAYLGLSLTLAAAATASWTCVERATGVVPDSIAPGVRFLGRAILAMGLTWLLATAVNRWRVTSRTRRARRTGPVLRLGLQGLAAVAAGVLAARYVEIVGAAFPYGPVDVARLALIPFDPGRLIGAVGLLLAHATTYGAAVTWLGIAALVAGDRDGRRTWSRAIVVAGGLLAGAAWMRTSMEPWWPSVAAASGVMLMWLAVDRSRRWLRRGSQPARLAVLGAALLVPSLATYPSLAAWSARSRTSTIEHVIAGQVTNQRRDLQGFLRQAIAEIDATPGLADLVTASSPPAGGPVAADAAFRAWSQTSLSSRRLTSSVELYDRRGRMVSRFALNLPETSNDQTWRETACQWELFEEVSPFFAEERRLLHAGRGVCATGADGSQTILGAVVVHAVLDYANLPFLAAQNPYVDLLRTGTDATEASLRDALAFVVYGWSRRTLFVSGGDAWPLSASLFSRIASSREPFWTLIEDRGIRSDVLVLNDRGAIYAVGYPRTPLLGHFAALAELVALAGATFAVLLAAVAAGAVLGGRAPVSGRAFLREVRASFYRTLFLVFVAAVVVPVVALALVTRAYMATILRADIEQEATRTAISASRVVEDFGRVEAHGGSDLPVLDDSLLVWLSRVVGEDINVFAGTGLLASSERNLFASGLLPTRTPGDVYRALTLDGRPTHVTRENVGTYEYLVASVPVRLDDRQAIVSVPLTLRQRIIERQLDELDRRVLLAAIAFILLGSAIGYWAAERISDPVSRLTRATRRLAAGDLDARLLVRSSDELGRLVEAFNGMAADLQQQRGQLERTNRLEAWAEMARQVAHDIKNPLTPIQLNAEHLKRVHVDRGRPLGSLVDDCVANILLQVRLLRQLASEFSSFASSPQARPEPTLLQPLFDEILAPYELALAGRIVITREVAASVPPVMVDRVLLARALTNVIENGLHAMPGDGSLRVSASAEAEGWIAVVVTDTGIGMDESALARIFEPYFSTKATGTGLGLTIARRNVELNGGRIEVASRRGVGTSVTMHLPVAA